MPESSSDSVSKTDRPIPQTPDQARDAVLARWGRGGLQQPADQVPGATKMVTTPKAAPRSPAPPLSQQGRRTEQGWNWPLTWALLIYVSICVAFKVLAFYSLFLLALYLAPKLFWLGIHGVVWVLGRLEQTERGKAANRMMFKAIVASIVIGAMIMAIREWRLTVIFLGYVLVLLGIQVSWTLLVRSVICKRFLRTGFVAGISSFAKTNGIANSSFWFFAAVACLFLCLAWFDPVGRAAWILFGIFSGCTAAHSRSPRLEDLFWNSATQKVATREEFAKHNEKVEKLRKDLLQIMTPEEIEEAKQAVFETIFHKKSAKLIESDKQNEEIERAK